MATLPSPDDGRHFYKDTDNDKWTGWHVDSLIYIVPGY